MSECSDKDNKERYLIFDESGNLGTSGRYFVIACIDTYNYKALHNVMKRKLELPSYNFRISLFTFT